VLGEKMLALTARKNGNGGEQEKEPGVDSAYETGCVGRLMQLQHTNDGYTNLMIQALRRFRLKGVVQRSPYLKVEIELIEDISEITQELKSLAAALKIQVQRMLSLMHDVPDGAAALIDSIEEPGFLADFVASNLNTTAEEKQKILATIPRKERIERLLYLVAHEIEMLEISSKIQTEVRNTIDKNQRDYFLRQQMKAIQTELGEGDSKPAEAEEYRRRVEALSLPEEVRKEAQREVDRLARMNEASAEFPVIASYLDWIIELPWSTLTTDRLDIPFAAQILDEDHYGLNKVKKRILEYLAVRKLKPSAPGPILCFVGPPGVGKTSLGKSIARALDRKFIRMSLGGMRDEAEIRGHRKTYVGALPGRIIQGIRKAGSRNPVFMLDEIDKLGNDFRGDPSSALLEVLDPAQNDTFSDLYLNVPFDLSKVMFIATANVLDTIPWALRDRMEIVEIPGYTHEEKMEIAQRYLVPRQLDAHGLTEKNLRIANQALFTILDSYTREAGVRQLEREIGNVCRGSARLFAEGRKKSLLIKKDDLRTALGNPRVFHDAAERTRLPGVAIGMAWTATGGDILFIEATRMSGKGGLILTGQLGDVMKESAQAALSYIRANASKLGLQDANFADFDMHIHIPAGATPKDGPSAGVTLLTAVTSLLTGKCVRSRLAMTGEITLRGLVLPVGGVKDKVLAAARSGIREIILPERCMNDIEEVPDSVRSKLKFHPVKRVEEVLNLALGLKLE
jgi:ATP-dependent Lon protease